MKTIQAWPANIAVSRVLQENILSNRGVLGRRSLVAMIGLGVTGCSPFISTSGPTRASVTHDAGVFLENGQPNAKLGYALIAVNADVVSRLNSRDPVPAFNSNYMNRPPAKVAIGVGDVLTVEIFESHSGGLFIPEDAGSRPGNFIQLQPTQVDATGNITVPFAGTVRAAGLTPREVANAIQRRLADRALEPQVIVAVTEKHANDVSVLGDVNTATRFQMDPGGERILGAIARAGGPKSPDYETLVRLQRLGSVSTSLLSAIAQDPQQNIQLNPGDVVYVAHEPRYFLAVGATGQTTTLSQLDRRFPFGDYNLTLGDALAKAGGLQDDRANAQGVFLYRFETRDVLAQLGVSVPSTMPELVPTIYMVDLSDPPGLFYCNKIWMRNHDTIFVSNAPGVDILKFINIVLPFSQTGSYYRAATH